MTIETLCLGACMTNCYIASADEKHCIVVDPADNGAAIGNAIRKHGYVLDAVLLTHAHFDHIYGLPELLASSSKDGIPVYLHSHEVHVLTDMSFNLSESLFGIPFTYDGAVISVQDGDRIQAAGTHFDVLFTPGHTEGSVCYLCAEENVLFSGDTLFASTVGRTDFPGGDTPTLLASLKKLKALSDTLEVYPGHNAATTLAREKRYNEYLQ